MFLYGRPRKGSPVSVAAFCACGLTIYASICETATRKHKHTRHHLRAVVGTRHRLRCRTWSGCASDGRPNPLGWFPERESGFVSSGDEHVPTTLREGVGAVCPLRPQMCPRLSSDGNFLYAFGGKTTRPLFYIISD